MSDDKFKLTNDIKSITEIVEEANLRDFENEDDHEELSARITSNTERIAALEKNVSKSGSNRGQYYDTTDSDGTTYRENTTPVYNYSSEKLHYFDTKIDVPYWLTKQFGEAVGGKYNYSIRKDGIFCTMRDLTDLAASQAFNYRLADAAAYDSTSSSIEITNTDTGVIRTINLFPHASSAFDEDDIEWYLSNPYGIPPDMVEDHCDATLFSIKSEDLTKTSQRYLKLTTNCIACFYSPIAGTKIVITLIGAYRGFSQTDIRPEIPSTFNQNMSTASTPASIKLAGETIVAEAYQNWIDWNAGGRQGSITIPSADFMYLSISEATRSGHTIVLEATKNSNFGTSRAHIMNVGQQLILAKYLEDCDDQEIVDFEYDTMHSFELSVPYSPTGFTNDYIGISGYGNNTSTVPEVGTLEDIWKCACWNSNTYCCYGLMLHLYKGMTDTTKDTATPLIETVCSFDDGYVQITFPEAIRANLDTASGESSLNYTSTLYSSRQVESLFGATQQTYNDMVYKIDLTDNSLTFNNFEFANRFVITLDYDLANYTAKGEVLIATVGDMEIYLCYSDAEIYPLLNPNSSTYYSDKAIKIVDNKQQIYMGLRYSGDNWNKIINIEYDYGLWDVQIYNQYLGV